MRTLPVFLSFLASASPALAQASNIDIHNFYGTPSSALGAAASQPGVWNAVPATAAVTPLVDLAGSATSATISVSGLAVGYNFDNAGTAGDDQALMDDISDPSPSGATWTISGLLAGNYVLITYAWAPDNAVFRSRVAVAGSSDLAQDIGGAWSGGYVLGVTHALHHVSVAAGGSIAATITVPTGGQFASVNGFQVVPDAIGFVQHCFPGAGGIIPCPCANPPVAPGLGCDNFGAGPVDSGTLDGTGTPSLTGDTVVLQATGENNISLTVFFTGSGALSATGIAHAAGVRCVATGLKRLYSGSASAGAISRPGMGDPSVSARTAAVGAPISAGETRHYFNIYRDPGAATPCGDTASTVNLTNSGSLTWAP